jgi:hypothetical protein
MRRRGAEPGIVSQGDHPTALERAGHVRKSFERLFTERRGARPGDPSRAVRPRKHRVLPRRRIGRGDHHAAHRHRLTSGVGGDVEDLPAARPGGKSIVKRLFAKNRAWLG